MIPEIAIRAAARSLTLTGIREDWEELSDTRRSLYEHSAEAALEAALPHLEAALRKQIANDPGYYAIIHISGSTWNNALYHVIEQAAPSERRGAWHSAARIAEEGTLE